MSVKSLLISGSSLLFCFTKSNCCIKDSCKIKFEKCCYCEVRRAGVAVMFFSKVKFMFS